MLTLQNMKTLPHTRNATAGITGAIGDGLYQKLRELEGYLYSRKANREKTSVAELTMGVPVRHHLHRAYHGILGRACPIPP